MKKIIILIVCIFVLSCSKVTKSDIPKNAILRRSLGNGWVIFELEINEEIRQFLYHKKGIGYYKRECITELNKRSKYGK